MAPLSTSFFYYDVDSLRSVPTRNVWYFAFYCFSAATVTFIHASAIAICNLSAFLANCVIIPTKLFGFEAEVISLDSVFFFQLLVCLFSISFVFVTGFVDFD